MLDIPALPQQSHLSQQGTVEIWCPATALMFTRVVGVLVDEGAAAIESVMVRRAAEHGRLLVFNDWEGMTDYEHASRTRLTAATNSILDATERGHFLLRSKVVTFGVQVANTMLRKLTIHPSRAVFERAFQEALRQRRLGLSIWSGGGPGDDGSRGGASRGVGALGNGALGNGALGNAALGNGSLGNGALGNGSLGNGSLGNGSLGDVSDGEGLSR